MIYEERTLENFLLDAGVLGELCHPKNKKCQLKAKIFIEKVTYNNMVAFIPEIADYELRRELLRFAMQNNQSTSKSLERLDSLETLLNFKYLRVDTNIWRKAAELWAQARNTGQPIGDVKTLGGDVILAAQALAVEGTVVTTNVKHLSRFVSTKDWNQLINEWANSIHFDKF
ncbi:conserved hypothetical protein [Beggiatoa sp. PS]|nr:conserved hypothetical protein [Beggiatoa sp. PS]